MGSAHIRRPGSKLNSAQNALGRLYLGLHFPGIAGMKGATDQPCDFPVVLKFTLSEKATCHRARESVWVLSGAGLACGPRAARGAGAVVPIHHTPALVTPDCTAPLEFAVTAADGLSSSLFHLQAALCTQASTAALLPPGCVAAVLQTLPTFCARDAQAGIAGAVIW